MLPKCFWDAPFLEGKSLTLNSSGFYVMFLNLCFYLLSRFGSLLSCVLSILSVYVRHISRSIQLVSGNYHRVWTIFDHFTSTDISIVIHLFFPAYIRFLRVDALSLLLSMANVTANSDVLVLDMVGGLLTGAVAERLGGTEHVLFPIVLRIL